MPMFVRVAMDEIEQPFVVLVSSEMDKPRHSPGRNAIDREHIKIDASEIAQMRALNERC